MARKKTPPIRANVKAQISSRLREIRQELFGEHGGPELARRLNLPARTWYNYETGVTVPAEVLLGFIDQTGTNPIWLLTGMGPKYRQSGENVDLDRMTPEELIRRGLEKLEEVSATVGHKDGVSDYLSLELVPLSQIGRSGGTTSGGEGRILADRRWILNRETTIAAMIEDDSMAPILPIGSVVAIDSSRREPEFLSGRLAAAYVDGVAMVRWVDLSGRHLILRPNQPSREHPIIPIEFHNEPPKAIIGQIVWSWTRFDG